MLVRILRTYELPEILMLAAATLCVVVSITYLLGADMMHCVQCNTELVAPERSEYLSDQHVCHIWLCPACSACFESLVLFPTDSESMGDQFARPNRAGHHRHRSEG
jgi:hypothetical protein